MTTHAQLWRLVRRAAPAWGIWLAVPAGVLLPLMPTWLAGDTIISRDSIQLFAPVRPLIGEALRAFRLPLWNPYSATGMPLLAQTIHAVLHPISVACAFLFPRDRLDPIFASSFVLGAMGAALLARRLGASRAAAASAGLAYGLSGFMLSMASYVHLAAGAGTLPWLAVGLRAAASPGVGALASGAVAVAATAFSGDIQTLAFGTVLALALAADAGGWRGAVRAAVAVAVGLGLASVQLFPSWCYFPLTDRVLPADDLREWAFVPARLIELAVPGFFAGRGSGLDTPVYVALARPEILTTPLAFSVYVGAATLVLAAAGVRRVRSGWVLAGASVVFLWLSFGHRFGAQQLLEPLPLIGRMRYAEKHIAPLTLCLSVLAALGVDTFGEGKRSARRVAGAAVCALAIAVVAWGLLKPAAASGWLAALHVSSPELVRTNLIDGLPHPIAALALLGALAGAVAAGWLGSRPARIGAALLIWAAAAAAARTALRPGSVIARGGVPPPHLSAAPPGPRVQIPLGVAGRTPGGPRPPTPGWNEIDQLAFDFAAIAAPNHNVEQRIDDLDVDTGLRPLRHRAAFEAHEGAWDLLGRRYAATHVVLPPADVITAPQLGVALRGAVLVGEEPRTKAIIWAIPHRQWALFPAALEIVPDREAATSRLSELVRAGQRTAVLEHAGPLALAPGRVLGLSRALEEVSIEAEADGDSVLIVNDAYWPGWKASLDGNERPIFPADVLVRAIEWPAGRHHLLMRYDPPEVRLGVWFTAATAVALVTAMALARRSRPRAGGGSQSREPPREAEATRLEERTAHS